MTILELREKRAKAWDAAKAFLDSHRTDKGTLSAEDDAAYSRMEQDITDLGKEIARMERREALDAELNKPVSQPITGKPAGDQQAEKKGRASMSTSGTSGTPCVCRATLRDPQRPAGRHRQRGRLPGAGRI